MRFGVECCVMGRNLSWESVSWRSGLDHYRFDIERGGLFATLNAPGDRAITLPMAVWESLLDALKANRATRQRGEQQHPARSRARWYDGEVSEVAAAFQSGRSIPEIAHAHNRSAYAIEHQLDRLGLISKAQIYGPDRNIGDRPYAGGFSARVEAAGLDVVGSVEEERR